MVLDSLPTLKNGIRYIPCRLRLLNEELTPFKQPFYDTLENEEEKEEGEEDTATRKTVREKAKKYGVIVLPGDEYDFVRYGGLEEEVRD
jgi:hypothetical protein